MEIKNTNIKKKILLWLSVISLTIYVVWRLLFTIPTKYGPVVLACGILMLLCELISALETILHLSSTTHIYEPELPDIPDEWYPDVDVFIATHNEPYEVLYKTANGCKHMKYPDKSKVHIYFCDDGEREWVKELADKMGIGYQGIKNNKLAKAGNLNFALANTSGELIATFDADMIPTRNFLIKTVPYFFLPKMKKLEDGTWVERTKDEIDPKYKIGFIQTPQSFYNPDLFQYNLYSEDAVPNEQDYFFREINVSRNYTNSPIYAGSNTLISREALELVGGIATGTITEDFETGIHIQEAGYTTYATSGVYAHGLAPDTIDSLIKQRERWGRGCIFSLRRINVWADKKMPFKAKISYFSCELYWWSYFRRLVYVLAPILFMLFNVPVITCEPWEMFVFWLPCYLLSNFAAKRFSSGIRTSRWSDIVDTVLFPYMIIPIFQEAIGIKKTGFHVTEKKRAVNEQSNAILALPHIILAALSVIAIIRSVGQIIQYESIGPVIILYWLVVNLGALLMAIFFMLGRTNHRYTERYYVNIPVKLKLGEDIFADTTDVSEGGFAVMLNQPVDIPVHDFVDVELHTNHYSAAMQAKLVNVYELKDGWKYSFKIVQIDEENEAEYLQMVYDRHPSLPDSINNKTSVFGDIKSNLKKRSKSTVGKTERRTSVRVPLGIDIASNSGDKVRALDYNFRYIVLESENGESFGDELSLYPLGEDDKSIEMKLEYRRSFYNTRQLYYIKNHSQIAFDEKMMAVVNEWLDNNISIG